MTATADDTMVVARRQADRLRDVLDKPHDYPADLLPWPQQCVPGARAWLAAEHAALAVERQRDVLAEALTDIADAGCSAGWGGCLSHGAHRGDWCDECTAAEALQRAGLR